MRQKNSIKNIISTIIPYFILTILGFFRVRIYLSTLGQDIYSLNQLFSQIFAYISIVEAGAGALVTQLYYKALADGNRDQINIIYTSSKYTLRRIATIILAIGLVVSFFLNYLTNNTLSLQYMQVAFILYLIRSVLEYLMLSPRFVLQADQKIYKINTMFNAYKVVEIVAEIALLKLGIDYLLILIVTIVIRIISYYLTNKRIFKEYKWLKSVHKNKCIKIKGMGNVFCHKISGAVYNNTDILLISSFLTTTLVTIYSSYNYIIKFMDDISYMCASSIAPSMGNVMVKENIRDKRYIFEEINMAFFTFAMIIVITLNSVITPFVKIWLGDSLTMDKLSLGLMLFALFHFVARRPMSIMNEVNNLFKLTQKVAIPEAAINLVLSFILVNKIGMPGVLLATLLSTLLSNFWAYPYIVYTQVLDEKPFNYYYRYFFSIAVSALICFISDKFIQISSKNYFYWFINSVIYFLVICCIVFLINWASSKHFRSIVFRGLRLVKNIGKGI